MRAEGGASRTRKPVRDPALRAVLAPHLRPSRQRAEHLEALARRDRAEHRLVQPRALAEVQRGPLAHPRLLGGRARSEQREEPAEGGRSAETQRHGTSREPASVAKASPVRPRSARAARAPARPARPRSREATRATASRSPGASASRGRRLERTLDALRAALGTRERLRQLAVAEPRAEHAPPVDVEAGTEEQRRLRERDRGVDRRAEERRARAPPREPAVERELDADVRGRARGAAREAGGEEALAALRLEREELGRRVERRVGLAVQANARGERRVGRRREPHAQRGREVGQHRAEHGERLGEAALGHDGVGVPVHGVDASQLTALERSRRRRLVTCAGCGGPRMLRALSLLLTFATGASGLVYEVAWQRYLATLLGSHSEATAAVLAIFLGGLSVGYSLFGRLTRRIVEDARRRAGAPAPPPRLRRDRGGDRRLGARLPVALRRRSRRSRSRVPHGTTGVGFAFDVLLATLLIGPPTVLMGGTIPILTQALARGLEDATRFHALVYAFNTLGAFVGALAAGFFLVPWLGLVTLMYAVGAVNLAAGSVFVLLGLRARAARARPRSCRATRRACANFAVYAAIALLVGFAMMAIQTVAIRVAGLSIGSSHFTFSMVVAVFVLCIAIGSLAVSLAPGVGARTLLVNQVGPRRVRRARSTSCAPYAPYGAHLLRGVVPRRRRGVLPVLALPRSSRCWSLIGPVAILSGAPLPLLFHHLRREAGELGAVAGPLYSWNTVGSLLGALLGGYALLFLLDLHHVYRIGVAALVLAAGLVAILPARRACAPVVAVRDGRVARRARGSSRRGTRPGCRPGSSAARDIAPSALTSSPAASSTSRGGKSKLLFYDDDPVSTVDRAPSSTHANGRSRASLINNGKSDGNTDADYPTMGLIAMISALLADKAESAFVIGCGTGVTAGELAALDEHEVRDGRGDLARRDRGRAALRLRQPARVARTRR